MLQSFDKDFFKFLISFVAIIVISLVFVVFLREYESRSKIKITTPVVNLANPKS